MLSKWYESTEVLKSLAICSFGDSLVHQQGTSPSSSNIKRIFYLDVYTILNRIRNMDHKRISGTGLSSVILSKKVDSKAGK